MGLTFQDIINVIEDSDYSNKASFTHFFHDDVDKRFAVYALKAVCQELGWSYSLVLNNVSMQVFLFKEY